MPDTLTPTEIPQALAALREARETASLYSGMDSLERHGLSENILVPPQDAFSMAQGIEYYQRLLCQAWEVLTLVRHRDSRWRDDGLVSPMIALLDAARKEG